LKILDIYDNINDLPLNYNACSKQKTKLYP